jgi:adenosylcobinamide-GDP ribazoletransferase
VNEPAFDRSAEMRFAVTLLTRLPVAPAGGTLPPDAVARALWAFPLVGTLIGLLCGAGLFLCALMGFGPWAAAVVVIALEVALTGGLHEDGIADVADGFGGGRDRIAKLAIMRDSRIGSYGTITLWLILATRLISLATILDGSGVNAGICALIASHALSRAWIALPLHMLPAARSDGLGAGTGAVDLKMLGASLGVALAVTLLILPFGPLLSAWSFAALAALGVTILARRQIGGQTGDVLGAVASAVLAAVLLALTSWS